jgi:phosphate starvation-inducible membrane PsiE
MSEKDKTELWAVKASTYLGHSESAVLVLIGGSLAIVALLLLFAGMRDLWVAARTGEIETKAIDILNTILLVMMTMEIVYTVAISLRSHTLNAEPFLIIGAIAAIRRMLVITATSTEREGNFEQFRNTLVELGLLSTTVIAMAVAIWILRMSQRKYVDRTSSTIDDTDSHG